MRSTLADDTSPFPQSTDPGTPLLRIRHLRAGFGQRTILDDVSLDVAPVGIHGVLGPGGVGKSTLLRTLARWNEAIPSFWTEGHTYFDGRDLHRDLALEEARTGVALLAQKARLYTATILENAIAGARDGGPLSLREKSDLAEHVLDTHGLWDLLAKKLYDPVTSLSIGQQRMLSLARLSSGGAQCLLVDEPLRDLDSDDTSLVEPFLQRLGKRCAIVMVTHNQRLARALCDQVSLITAGAVAESASSADFFREPKSELGRRYLKTGNCWPDVTPDSNTTPSPTSVEGWQIPRSFHWVIKGTLGGVQWPGLLEDVQTDLTGLRALGVKVLVSLTETSFDANLLRAHRIGSVHFPIEDMGVPTLEGATKLCRRVCGWLDRKVPVAFHCKAGLGRTGTMLACVLVCRGAEPVRAVHEVRLVNPHYIQSERQLRFISEFREHLSTQC